MYTLNSTPFIKGVYMKAFVFIFSVFVSISGIADTNQKDPFEKIITGKLKNEMNYFIVSSPHAKLTSLEFRVKTGHKAEKPREYGLAHLVEHLIFRENELKDNMSYLQVFKDKGGDVNAYVSSRITKYIVTIPSEHSLWALELLTKMLQERTFTQSELKKAKKAVMIEIGEPSPLEKYLNISFYTLLSKLLYPLKGPNFFKNEFGVDFSKNERPYNANRINNAYLSLDQAQNFYENFYIPKNIKVLVAGNFDTKKVTHFINKKWENYRKGVEGKVLPKRDEPHLVDRPVYSINSSHSSPSMQLGIKVAHITLKDSFILSSYTEFVAEEIMKGIRNKKGETYTAYEGSNLYKRHGSMYVQMDSTSESFGKNLKNLKTLLLEKPQREGISKDDFKKSKLYLKHSFKSSYEENAYNLLSNLYTKEWYQREYNFSGSPLRLVESLSLEDYNQTLKQYIKPKRYIIRRYPKYFLFYYESFIITMLSLMLFLFMAKKMVQTPFDHFKIRFVKKVKVPPFKIGELSLVIIAVSLSSILSVLMSEYIFYNNKILNTNLITGAYLPSVLFMAMVVGISIYLLSLLPKKIYLTNNSLCIKSMTYKMREIPISKIEKFESMKLWKVFFSFKRLSQIKHRLYVFRYVPWKSVLLIHLKNGKIILLDCDVTDSINKGLSGWLAS